MHNRQLTLGHSPDPDDAYMFYPLTRNLIPTHGYTFRHIIQDIHTLNQRATRAELDITAISIHAYAHLTHHYTLLPNGASMGDGYGPLLVAKQHYTKQQITQKTIAIPGPLTTAHLALQLWLQKPATQLHTITLPFHQIPHAVQTGKTQLGLLIHEAQLTHKQHNLTPCQDLGHWWKQQTNLPLPLGANAITNRLPPNEQKTIAQILHQTIQHALNNPQPALQHAQQYARGTDPKLTHQFIQRYVNHWTLDYGTKGRQAIQQLLTQAHQQKLIPHKPNIQYTQ